MFQNPEEEKTYRYTILNLLTRLSVADQSVTEEEKIFILKVAKQLGVTPDEFINMRYDSQIQNMDIPASEKERMSMLYYLLFLMKIDGKISEDEANLIRHVSFRLGFHHDLTEELIETISFYANKKLPPEKLLEKIKKYLN